MERDPSSESLLTKSLTSITTLGLTMAITIPLGIVTRIWVPRVLGSKDAGILFFAESFPVFFMNFMTLGAPYYIQKYVPPRPEHAREIFDSIGLSAATTAILLALCLVGFMNESDYDSLTIKVTAVMIGYQAMQIYCSEFIQKIFYALGHYGMTSIITIITKGITVLFVAASLLLGGGIISVASGFALAQSVNLFLMLGLAKKACLLGGGIRLSLLKPVIAIGLPFLFGGTVSTINSTVDTFCLARFANFTELGFYGTSQRVLGLFLMPLPIISQVFGPLLSRLHASRNLGQYSQVLTDITRTVVVMMCPLAWGLVLFRWEIIRLLYGSEFAPSSLSLIIQGPMLICSALSTVFAMSAITTNTGKSFSLILVLGAIINLGLDYLLIPFGANQLGTGGAALGSLLASLFVVTGEMGLFLIISGDRSDRFSLVKIILSGLVPTLLVSIGAFLWSDIPISARVLFLVLMVPGYFFAMRLVTARDIKRLSVAWRSIWESLGFSKFYRLSKRSI